MQKNAIVKLGKKVISMDWTESDQGRQNEENNSGDEWNWYREWKAEIEGSVGVSSKDGKEKTQTMGKRQKNTEVKVKDKRWQQDWHKQFSKSDNLFLQLLS